MTHNRYPYLKINADIDLFFITLERVKELFPFDLLAYVILPDHFHWLMKVGDPTGNLSKIMHSIKRNYTRNFKQAHHIQEPINIWQRGFWDHVIRDERDLENHLDYIHWNPIKHGHVSKPEDWTNSTYNDWFRRGYYEFGWGWYEVPENINNMEFE